MQIITNSFQNISLSDYIEEGYKLLFAGQSTKLTKHITLLINDNEFTNYPESFIQEINQILYFQGNQIFLFDLFHKKLLSSKLIKILNPHILSEILITKAFILAKHGQKGHLNLYLDSQVSISNKESKSINYLVILSNYFFFTNKMELFIKVVENNFIKNKIFTNTIIDLEIYNIIGVYRGIKGQLTKAFDMFYNIIYEASKINFVTKIAIAKTNLATIEAKLYNYGSALNLYNEILDNYNNYLDSARRVYIINNVAHLELQNDNVDKAAKLLKRLVLKEIPNKSPFYELTICQLARINILQKNFALAKTHLNQYDTFKGTKHHEAIHFLNVAMYQKTQHRAIIWALKSKKKCIETKNNDCLLESLQFLSNQYKDNDPPNYIQTLEDIINLKDTFLILQKKGQNTDIKIKTLLKEKEVQIKTLEQEAKHNALILQKNKEIEKTNKKLQEKVEELKTFAYIVSHDLKEPMRMITSFAKLLVIESINLNLKSKEYLNFIMTGTQRMNELLDGLYKYTSIDSRRNNYIEEIDLNKIILSVINNLRMVIQEEKAIISYEKLPIITSNHILLIQLFQNLISNAIKFTHKDKTPKIIISYEASEKYYIISLKDNGIGISKKNQIEIFEVFRTLNTKEEYPGTGIGLSICKKIIKYLNGKVIIESEIGNGSTFNIFLPKAISKSIPKK